MGMRVINAKSDCCGLGYYGESIRAPSALTACAILDFWTKANWMIGYAPPFFLKKKYLLVLQFMDYTVLISPRSRQQRYLCSIRGDRASELDAQYG